MLTIAGLVLAFNNFWANIAGTAIVFGLLALNALAARRQTLAHTGT